MGIQNNKRLKAKEYTRNLCGRIWLNTRNANVGVTFLFFRNIFGLSNRDSWMPTVFGFDGVSSEFNSIDFMFPPLSDQFLSSRNMTFDRIEFDIKFIRNFFQRFIFKIVQDDR